VNTRFPTSNSPLRTLLAVAAAATLIAACGSSSSSNKTSPARAGVTASAASVAATAASAATLTTVKVAGYGTVLASAKGKAVYLFSADPKNGSKCSGSCAKTWVPVTVTGKPKAGAGVKASLISTFKRKAGGGTQVSYDGHALYTYPGSPLQGSGAGQASNGGIWYLVATNGQPIKKTTGGGY
jgi:predicted lipoprotein with Yx(FWY)xxD motif